MYRVISSSKNSHSPFFADLSHTYYMWFSKSYFRYFLVFKLAIISETLFNTLVFPRLAVLSLISEYCLSEQLSVSSTRSIHSTN